MMDLPRLKIGIDIKTKMPVYIRDRHKPTIVSGKSGTGKSTLIENFWQEDHYYGNAKVLVDPSGFLARDCYSISRGKYCSLESPVPINPMRGNYTEPQIVSIIMQSLNQVVTASAANTLTTVKMWDILDEEIKFNLSRNRKSLLNVLASVKNRTGNNETRDGLISRLNFLLNDDRMIKIICGNNSIEWGELIKNKETLIVDCSGMSKEQMIFMGSIVCNGFKDYFRYARVKEYFPVSLYIDECHNFLSSQNSIFDILKESRKYAISCTLATQDMATMDERLARVMLNSGNLIAYRLGYREANLFAREMEMSANDIQFIEKFHLAYLTPQERGIAKAPRPPIIKEVELPKTVEPQRNSKKPSWFTLEPLESYPQAESQ